MRLIKDSAAHFEPLNPLSVLEYRPYRADSGTNHEKKRGQPYAVGWAAVPAPVRYKPHRRFGLHLMKPNHKKWPDGTPGDLPALGKTGQSVPPNCSAQSHCQNQNNITYHAKLPLPDSPAFCCFLRLVTPRHQIPYSKSKLLPKRVTRRRCTHTQRP